MTVHDLVNAENRYHNKYKQEFYSGSPTNAESPRQPKNLTHNENVCEWLEAEGETGLSEAFSTCYGINASFPRAAWTFFNCISSSNKFDDSIISQF